MTRLVFPLLSALLSVAVAAPSAPGWRFDLKAERSGIVALESIVVSPTLVVFFDRASNDPLQINNHSAWGALWDLETSTVKPLDVLTNSFCASGALLSNGTMVSLLHPYEGHHSRFIACIRPVLEATRMASPATQTSGPALRPSAFSSPAPLHPAKAARSSRTPSTCTSRSPVGTRHPFASSTAAS